MNDNKRFWDRNAKRYQKMQRNNKKSEIFFQKLESDITSFLNKDMNVLELAMGPAMLTKAIASNSKSLVATDYSQEMVNEAKNKDLPSNVKLEVCDCTNMPYIDKTFDAVVIANCLHIIPDPIKALNEIRRVLKDDGLLIAPTYTRNMGHITPRIILMVLGGFKTYSKWTDKKYIAFLRENNWTIIHNELIYGNDFPECFVVARKNNNNNLE